MTPDIDLALVGGGLSASRLFAELVTLMEPGSASLRIALFDRLGAFGRGVPYGPPSRPGFLLIESVDRSTPADFSTWLRVNRQRLMRATRSQDPVLAAWARENSASLGESAFGDLFVPRSRFGRYAREQLRHSVSTARRGGAEIHMVTAEVVDVRHIAPDRWTVVLAGGRTVTTRTVVLAIGGIPQVNRYGLTLADGYVHDLYRDGYGGLDAILRELDRSMTRSVRIVLVGSNASAAEFLHYLAHQPRWLARTAVIEVISGSGRLPGTASTDLAAGVRPSPAEYVRSSQRLAAAGKLELHRGTATWVGRTAATLRVHVDDGSSIERRPADLVVNCTGAGRLDRTDSTLLTNLVARGFEVDSGRGFRVDPRTLEVSGAEGIFVIGPMLNRAEIETHVESIHAVYRTAVRLSTVIYRRLRPAGDPVAVISGRSHDGVR